MKFWIFFAEQNNILYSFILTQNLKQYCFFLKSQQFVYFYVDLNEIIPIGFFSIHFFTLLKTLTILCIIFFA